MHQVGHITSSRKTYLCLLHDIGCMIWPAGFLNDTTQCRFHCGNNIVKKLAILLTKTGSVGFLKTGRPPFCIHPYHIVWYLYTGVPWYKLILSDLFQDKSIAFCPKPHLAQTTFFKFLTLHKVWLGRSTLNRYIKYWNVNWYVSTLNNYILFLPRGQVWRKV